MTKLSCNTTAKLVKDTLKELNWEIFLHQPYSPDLTPSEYHLFASMEHSLAEQHFPNFESRKMARRKVCLERKKICFGIISIICLKDGQNVLNPMVNTLNKNFVRFP